MNYSITNKRDTLARDAKDTASGGKSAAMVPRHIFQFIQLPVQGAPEQVLVVQRAFELTATRKPHRIG